MSIQADFIELMNDWFDIFNSRHPNQTLHTKQPFGFNINFQMDFLDRVEEAIKILRVGSHKYLFPFQRGMLISIHSLRGLFNDVSGSSFRFVTYNEPFYGILILLN
jgi:hypothetical protein